jgi:hypothetical protein
LKAFPVHIRDPEASGAKRIEYRGIARVGGKGSLPQGSEAAKGDVMVNSKVDHIGYGGGAILRASRSRYPEAYDVFEKELKDL